VSDDRVRDALRSDEPLVVIEAPAGCGKTYQAASYALELASKAAAPRTLVLTHTHAACSVLRERTSGAGGRVEIRTIDSLIVRMASAYHQGLGLPADVSTWVIQRPDGYAEVAALVSALLKRHPMIGAALARRYPVAICDEHQDSSGDQHEIVMTLLRHRARVRVFADPMQTIFAKARSSPPYDWAALTAAANVVAALETPHRWTSGCRALGEWVLAARQALKAGGRVDLTRIPSSVSLVFAENQARRNLEYQVPGAARRPIDAFEKAQQSLLILTRYNGTAASLRSFFNRRIPLWEGYTRSELEKLVNACRAEQGNGGPIASAIVTFMGEVGIGFTQSAFGAALVNEVVAGCNERRRGKPKLIQELARLLVAEPDHRGVGKLLRRLSELRLSDEAFSAVKVDRSREFAEAMRLADFENVDDGLAALTHRRAYSGAQPPARAVSTIHKAKGLECGGVIVMPCDSKTFPDRPDARCLLYVALSRAKDRLLLVLSREDPSPLFAVP
jgi:superfamily I DNA/RNA helicase